LKSLLTFFQIKRNTPVSELSFARYFVVYSSLFLLTAIMFVFAVGPAVNLPLDYNQSFTVVKQVAPVFIGYLGQCAYYVTRKQQSEARLVIPEKNLIYAISVGPFVIFSTIFSAIIAVFIFSNRPDAPPDTGMSFNRFTDWITILLGLFTATVSVVTAWLFAEAAK
jgi:hypothetical protein